MRKRGVAVKWCGRILWRTRSVPTQGLSQTQLQRSSMLYQEREPRPPMIHLTAAHPKALMTPDPNVREHATTTKQDEGKPRAGGLGLTSEQASTSNKAGRGLGARAKARARAS